MTQRNRQRAKNRLRRHSIIELPCAEARVFLLKHRSYFTMDLPPYFEFSRLLTDIDKVLTGKDPNDFRQDSPRDFDDINHKILNNKDGQYAWRPMEIIHPVLYVSLVHKITEPDAWAKIRKRFAVFSRASNIVCLSLPVESLTDEKDTAEQINQWWEAVEQKSIELSLDYEFIIRTDIADCYAAIYTHSIAWALHTKRTAKKQRGDKNLIGNVIDNHIQDMHQGQTNGIPQGSVLMDLIAEMVLGYADTELAKKIRSQGITAYHILRYRDDYRLFVHNSQDGESILKCLTEVMIDLGLQLNPEKTDISNEVIRSSIKDDKLRWMLQNPRGQSLQKHLLVIHHHSKEYPNAGSVMRAMHDYYKRLQKAKGCPFPLSLISIVIDIAYHNPRTYPIAVAILSKLVSFLATAEEKQKVFERIKRKFDQIPNTGYLRIWLQRISLEFSSDIRFDEPLCQLVNKKNKELWNKKWISSTKLKAATKSSKMIDLDKLGGIGPIVSIDEVDLYIPDEGGY